MNSIAKHIITGLKGYAMGAANVVPGVSGGTIALITGIYSEIIGALNSLMEKKTWQALLHGRFKEFWQCVHGPFLLALAVGILLSVFSLAKLMEFVLAHYPVETWSFFFGLIVASALIMFKGIESWKAGDVALALGGAVLGVLVCTLSPTTTPDSFLFVFLCGAIAICTMILPGISGSFVLVIMGKYEYIMNAISALDIPVLLVFGLGCIVGILAFSKFLHWLLGKAEKQTMVVLLGFVLGSLVKVWPWSDKAAIAASQGNPDVLQMHVGGAIICCVLGIVMVLALELSGRSKTSDTKDKDKPIS